MNVILVFLHYFHYSQGIVQRILEEWHKKDVFPSELVYALLQDLGNEPMDDVGNGKGQMERNIIGKVSAMHSISIDSLH